MGRPKIYGDMIPQPGIKNVLERKEVQRTLAWLHREAKISYPLLHQIVTGKRRLQKDQAKRIIDAFHRFNINVTPKELFCGDFV